MYILYIFDIEIFVKKKKKNFIQVLWGKTGWLRLELKFISQVTINQKSNQRLVSNSISIWLEIENYHPAADPVYREGT